MHFVTKLRPTFWNLHKITDFLIPIQSYFEREKFQTLSGFCQKKFSKNSLERKPRKIMKNAFSILVLDFQSESIFRWARCRFQNHSTLVYSVHLLVKTSNNWCDLCTLYSVLLSAHAAKAGRPDTICQIFGQNFSGTSANFLLQKNKQ